MASRLSLVLAVLATALVGCRRAPPAPVAPSAAAASEHVTLVFSACVAGQLVPCGCSPDQLGGLPRAAALLARLRKDAPDLLYVDAGDLLFDGVGQPSAERVAQSQRKARTLAQGEELLGANARVLGLRDIGPFGPGFARESAGKVPVLASTEAAGGAANATLLHAGKIPVGLLALASGNLGSEGARMREAAAALRKQGARVVVLVVHPSGSAGAFAAAQAALPAAREAGIDLVILGHRDEPSTDTSRQEAGPPPLLAVEGHLQKLLRVDLELPSPGAAPTAGTPPPPPYLALGEAGRDERLRYIDDKIARTEEQVRGRPELKQMAEARIAKLKAERVTVAQQADVAPPGALRVTARSLPLDASVGSDAAAEKLVAAYDDAVSAENLREAQKLPESCPRPQKGEKAFVGVSGSTGAGGAPKAKGCAECHASEVEFWQGTKHSHAYETLVQARKQFSYDCIQCHVTGWRQPGGVCRLDRTEALGPGVGGRGVGRRDVQCESCHGPASEHVADPPEHIAGKVPVAVCQRCHEAANSPRFDDARYRPFILGPGHGAPLARGEKPHPFASGAGPNAGAGPRLPAGAAP